MTDSFGSLKTLIPAVHFGSRRKTNKRPRSCWLKTAKKNADRFPDDFFLFTIPKIYYFAAFFPQFCGKIDSDKHSAGQFQNQCWLYRFSWSRLIEWNSWDLGAVKKIWLAGDPTKREKRRDFVSRKWGGLCVSRVVDRKLTMLRKRNKSPTDSGRDTAADARKFYDKNLIIRQNGSDSRNVVMIPGRSTRQYLLRL